jgi:hypothetical protein
MAEITVKTFDALVDKVKLVDKNGKVTESPESIYEFLFDPDEAKTFHEQHPHLQLWTMVECEGSEYIVSGYHYVNRTGYLFTEILADNAIFDECRDTDGSVEFLYWDKNEA